MLLKRPQPSRNSVSPLVEAPKPNLESRLRRGNGRLLDVPAGGCLRSGLNNRLSSSLRAGLSRLSGPPSLPSRIKRHLPHLAHPILGDAGDHQRLVDPRLELIQRRNGAPGNGPVVSAVAFRSLDTREFTVEEGGNSVL
jgi:hypothetical protein